MSLEIRIPVLGESIVEGTIKKWLKKVGDRVQTGEALVELETDKVNLEVPAESDGLLASLLKNEGDTVQVGEVIGTIGDQVTDPVQASTPTAPAAPAAQPATNPPTNTGPPSESPVTPVAQRVAAEHQIDPHQVTGSGPGGRVTKEDVLKTVGSQESEDFGELSRAVKSQKSGVKSQEPPPAPRPSPLAPSPLAPSPLAARPEERQKMSRRRQTIARRLVEAQQSAAMLTTFNEVDMSKVMEIRKRRKESFQERHGVGLGFMSFFSKAVIGALKQFPLLNAEIQGDELLIKHYYDIGIAVGTAEGLVVPVVRDADKKSFAEIERTIGDLAKRAREGTLTLHELQGGTFTITNGGVYGSLMSTPILNAPQVGILGMHKIQERPIVVDGTVVVRPMMYLALSYDHRIVDGSDSVRFLVKIKEFLEDPESLLLES